MDEDRLMEVIKTQARVLLKILSWSTLESNVPGNVEVSRELGRPYSWTESEKQKPERRIAAVLQVFAGNIDLLLIEVKDLSEMVYEGNLLVVCESIAWRRYRCVAFYSFDLRSLPM
jgi:hypothetical protein